MFLTIVGLNWLGLPGCYLYRYLSLNTKRYWTVRYMPFPRCNMKTTLPTRIFSQEAAVYNCIIVLVVGAVVFYMIMKATGIEGLDEIIQYNSSVYVRTAVYSPYLGRPPLYGNVMLTMMEVWNHFHFSIFEIRFFPFPS